MFALGPVIRQSQKIVFFRNCVPKLFFQFPCFEFNLLISVFLLKNIIKMGLTNFLLKNDHFNLGCCFFVSKNGRFVTVILFQFLLFLLFAETPIFNSISLFWGCTLFGQIDKNVFR